MKLQILARMKKRPFLAATLLLAAAVTMYGAAVTFAGARPNLSPGTKTAPSQREQAVGKLDFFSPGLVITINSAQISSTGTITVTYTLTDPGGSPLDASGVTTPGVISLAYVAAYIPKGQTQYVAYTTAQANGAALGTITRPNFELGGTAVAVGPGQYQYTFRAKAPSGYDATATTTVAVDGNRDLSVYNQGISYAGTTFNFVPNGAAVTVTRDIIRTQSCNGCHDQLAFHGGYAHGMEMCVLCHQPQNADPATGNTLDLKVMAHKIHMGSQLPSVVGTKTTPGVPYQIIGYMNSVNDFSKVVDPADPRRCEVCHSQTTGAAQATAYFTQPTRAACGACHDDVDFATGANHAGGFQWDDNECAACHFPLGETPFDSSIKGAHVVPTDTMASYPQNPNTLIGSVVVAITGVTNTSAGQNPVVAFTVKDQNGNPLALSTLGGLSFTMAGPTHDYGNTNFGSDVTTPGYVTENGAKGTCDASGNCTYTFLHAIPAAATGSYAIGVEAVRTETVLLTTNAQTTLTTGTPNQVVYFSVDGSPLTARRKVVQVANCNACHVQLQLHGGRRNNPEYCVMCHNPANTDVSTRSGAVVASDKALPPQTINFAVMVHRIHDGVNVVPAGGQPFIIVGHSGSHNDFSDVLYPGMSPTGEATYLQNCSVCHVNGSEQNLPVGLNPVVDPQGWINPIQPTSSACSGCHVSKEESSHFLANTDSLGESCAICHGAGSQYAVDSVHVK